MSNKTFLITMEDDQSCDYRGYSRIDRLFFCSRTDLKPCGGWLKERPEWCPLVEVEDLGPNAVGQGIWREV